MTLPAGITLRPARSGDLPACEEIWRDGLNDYLVPLGQMEIPPDNPSLRLLHAHALATDPERFWVAVEAAAGGADDGGEIVAFGAAVQREAVWFLSMLFVRPGRQLGGLGRALLERILPMDRAGVTLAVATDPAQPISNGLYASIGMPARLPIFNLVGRPSRAAELPPLPAGIQARPFDAPGGSGRPSDLELDLELAALDRDVLGFAHAEDHAFVRGQGRLGFGYRDANGRLLGYGYTSEVGRIGPLAARDAALLAPIGADLLVSVPPRGASAIWVPGEAGPLMVALIRAGLRIEGFPVLLGWSAPFADFGRYVPISPGLL
ncbi:MAG: GNAT family N-acetyltransferase [Chloroflexi bacterium]|nr:GNAT family N-acetyltransferase [Chloroflexota bacterium]